MYRLALAAGRVDVYGMIDEMSSSQLTGWQAYAAVEPFGPLVDDLRYANQMALTANVNRDPKKRSAFKPREFSIAHWPQQRRRGNWGAVKLWAMRHNAGIAK